MAKEYVVRTRRLKLEIMIKRNQRNIVTIPNAKTTVILFFLFLEELEARTCNQDSQKLGIMVKRNQRYITAVPNANTPAIALLSFLLRVCRAAKAKARGKRCNQ